MRPVQYSPSGATLLTAFALLNGLAVPAYAQDSKDDDKKSDSASESASASASATASDSASKTPSPTAKDSPSSTAKDSPSSTAKDSPSPTDSSDSSSDSKTTASPTSTKSSSGDSSTENGGLTGLPTLTGVVPIPTYAAPGVPDTKDAPFMQQSSAPEGTVFIAVGAILGAFFLAVLIWRAVSSLMLHRSVERASKAQHVANSKGSAAAFPAPPAPFYKYTDQESTRSLGQAPSGRGTRRTNRGNVPSTNLSQSNLFFSPTAGSGQGSNRGSTYLPSGFYAAGSAAPPHQGQSISMSNLNPVTGQHANGSRNTLNGSPPESPMFHARRDASSSSVNLAAPLQPGQRAPSAYLEDLLADDPSALPPHHMPASGSRR